MTDKNQELKIVLVYLGKKLPKYVLSNLDHLKNTFESLEIWLVTDSIKTIRKVQARGHKAWLFENSNSDWSEIKSNMDFPMDFRDGFWFLTIKRFIALEAFMKEKPSSTLHVEADVLVMPNFPLHHFKGMEQELAFPLANPENGVASTFYVKNLEAISNFNRYIEVIALQNSQLTDMNLLQRYLEQYPDRVQVLPSGPSSAGNPSGYFDGMAFGTFLLGQDPRNYRGWTLKYSQIDWHSDRVADLAYSLKDKRLFAKNEGQEIPIYSLHVHSKKAKLFQTDFLMNELSLAIEEYKFGPKRKFALLAFFPIVYSSMKRRIRSIKTLKGML
jgi:hypothetical protein